MSHAPKPRRAIDFLAPGEPLSPALFERKGVFPRSNKKGTHAAYRAGVERLLRAPFLMAEAANVFVNTGASRSRPISFAWAVSAAALAARLPLGAMRTLAITASALPPIDPASFNDNPLGKACFPFFGARDLARKADGSKPAVAEFWDDALLLMAQAQARGNVRRSDFFSQNSQFMPEWSGVSHRTSSWVNGHWPDSLPAVIARQLSAKGWGVVLATDIDPNGAHLANRAVLDGWRHRFEAVSLAWAEAAELHRAVATIARPEDEKEAPSLPRPTAKGGFGSLAKTGPTRL